MNQSLDALASNMEENSSSSVLNVYHYLANNHEDEFIPAANDIRLDFSSKISYIDTANTIINVELRI